MSSNLEKEMRKLVGRVTVDKSIKSHKNDPYFVKKVEAAQKTLEKCEFPQEILDRFRNNKGSSASK